MFEISLLRASCQNVLLFYLSIIFMSSTEVGISIQYLCEDLWTRELTEVINLSLLRRVKGTHQANAGSFECHVPSHILQSQLVFIPLDPLYISIWWCHISTLLETSIPQPFAALKGCRNWRQSTCLSSLPRFNPLNVLGYYQCFDGDIHQRRLDSIHSLQLCSPSIVLLRHMGTTHRIEWC